MTDRLTRIVELKVELAELEHAEKTEQADSPTHRLAIILHDTHCNWNHTDGCGWMYENARDATAKWKKGTAHETYLRWAQRLLASVTSVDVESLIDIIRMISNTRHPR